jgi:hypothetical protein
MNHSDATVDFYGAESTAEVDFLIAETARRVGFTILIFVFSSVLMAFV